MAYSSLLRCNTGQHFNYFQQVGVLTILCLKSEDSFKCEKSAKRWLLERNIYQMGFCYILHRIKEKLSWPTCVIGDSQNTTESFPPETSQSFAVTETTRPIMKSREVGRNVLRIIHRNQLMEKTAYDFDFVMSSRHKCLGSIYHCS